MCNNKDGHNQFSLCSGPSRDAGKLLDSQIHCGYKDLSCDCCVYELSTWPICVVFQQFVDRQNQSLYVCVSMATDQKHVLKQQFKMAFHETSNFMHNPTKRAPPNLIRQLGCPTKEAMHAVFLCILLTSIFYVLLM